MFAGFASVSLVLTDHPVPRFHLQPHASGSRCSEAATEGVRPGSCWNHRVNLTQTLNIPVPISSFEALRNSPRFTWAFFSSLHIAVFHVHLHFGLSTSGFDFWAIVLHGKCSTRALTSAFWCKKYGQVLMSKVIFSSSNLAFCMVEDGPIPYDSGHGAKNIRASSLLPNERQCHDLQSIFWQEPNLPLVNSHFYIYVTHKISFTSIFISPTTGKISSFPQHHGKVAAGAAPHNAPSSTKRPKACINLAGHRRNEGWLPCCPLIDWWEDTHQVEKQKQRDSTLMRFKKKNTFKTEKQKISGFGRYRWGKSKAKALSVPNVLCVSPIGRDSNFSIQTAHFLVFLCPTPKLTVWSRTHKGYKMVCWYNT